MLPPHSPEVFPEMRKRAEGIKSFYVATERNGPGSLLKGGKSNVWWLRRKDFAGRPGQRQD